MKQKQHKFLLLALTLKKAKKAVYTKEHWQAAKFKALKKALKADIAKEHQKAARKMKKQSQCPAMALKKAVKADIVEDTRKTQRRAPLNI